MENLTDQKSESKVWPNFLIVGAPKAGTTSLYEYLNAVPEIFMSSVKEPHYFAKNLVEKNDPILRPIRNKEEYLKLFKNAGNKKVIGAFSGGTDSAVAGTLVAKAIGTSVVTKEKQRKKTSAVESTDEEVIDAFNKIKSGEASRMGQKKL